MIQTKTEISIDPQGRWFYRDAEITQPDVLKYFKQNLHRNHRYFILNVFGELREEGDLEQVMGAPVFAISASPGNGGFEFLLDSDERITVPLEQIQFSGTDCLFFILPRGIPVRLKTSAMGHVGAFLEGPDEAPHWNNGEALRQGNFGDYLQR